MIIKARTVAVIFIETSKRKIEITTFEIYQQNQFISVISCCIFMLLYHSVSTDLKSKLKSNCFQNRRLQEVTGRGGYL